MMLLASWPPHSAAAPMDPTPPPTAGSSLDWDASFRDARRRTSSATAPSPTLAPPHQHHPYHQPQHRHTQSQSQSQHREHTHIVPRSEIALPINPAAHQSVPTSESQYLGAGTGAIAHPEHHPQHHHHHHSSSFEYFTGNNQYMSSPPLQQQSFPMGQYYPVQNTEASTSEATFAFAYTSPCSTASDSILPASTQPPAATLYQDHPPQPLSLPQTHHDDKLSLEDSTSASAAATAAASTTTRRRRENRYRNAPPGVLSRRRAQNRASQRAYRERKEQRIRDLEQLLREANNREETLAQAYVALQAEYDSVRTGSSTSPPSSSQSSCRCGNSTVATTTASAAKSSAGQSPGRHPPPAAPPPSLPPDSEPAAGPAAPSPAGPQVGQRPGIETVSAASSFDHLAAHGNHAAPSGSGGYAMPLDMVGFPRQI